MTPGPAPAELFGLADSLPCPGWVVLDAARNHRFTGELKFDIAPSVRVHLDQGRIYLAERATDPSLGARLLDAGALNPAQLEHGAIQVGATVNLGRLFERVPSVDREFVMLMTDMMNDECVAWVAGQVVTGVTSTPYRHHPSGIHRWDRPDDAVDIAPGEPLPAPSPTGAPSDVAPPTPEAPPPPPVPPVAQAQPVPSEPATEPDTLVVWGAGATGFAPSVAPDEQPDADRPDEKHDTVPGEIDSILNSDWADRLETHGLPEFGSDPFASPVSLPPLPADQRDRFELIWPSGEIDDDFDTDTAVDNAHDRDHDRAGPTARVVRTAELVAEPELSCGTEPLELWDFETTAPSFGPIEERDDLPHPTEPGVQPDPSPATDDVVLSMRKAVEAIEAESLANRAAFRSDGTGDVQAQHEAPGAPASLLTDETGIVVPGRVATRTESSLWSVRGFDSSTTRSVFDEAVSTPSLEPHIEEPVEALVEPTGAASAEAPRVSALRRLIGGLRRR